MSATEGDDQQQTQQQPIVGDDKMSVEDALQQVLKKSLVHDGLVRGLKECVKSIDKKQASLCILVDSVDEKEYTKLVEALCQERNINLIKVSDKKKLGEWSGLCRFDKEGNARKVVGTSCVVVKDYGEESEGRSVLLEHFASH